MNHRDAIYRLTSAADADISAILRRSMKNFGEAATLCHTRLLSITFREIARLPTLRGSRTFENDIRLYHLRHSIKLASAEGITVRRPRHFIAYRIAPDGAIEILRILHDAMGIQAHLGDE